MPFARTAPFAPYPQGRQGDNPACRRAGLFRPANPSGTLKARIVRCRLLRAPSACVVAHATSFLGLNERPIHDNTLVNISQGRNWVGKGGITYLF